MQHQEQFGVSCLALGHFDLVTRAEDGIPYLRVGRRPLYHQSKLLFLPSHVKILTRLFPINLVTCGMFQTVFFSPTFLVVAPVLVVLEMVASVKFKMREIRFSNHNTQFFIYTLHNNTKKQMQINIY